MLLLFFVTLPTWLATLWRRYLATGTAPKKQKNARRNILIVRLDQLGDLVLTTPLFRELKRAYPEAYCTAVVQPQFKSILTTNRHVDEILSPNEVRARWLPPPARRLVSALWFYWTELRHRHFDLAITPRWDVDESLATLLCTLATASKRIGYSSQASAAKHKFNRWFDAAFDLVLPAGPLQHEVRRNLAVVEALGAKVEDPRLKICLTDNDRRFAKELLIHHDQGRLLVALGIGGRAPGRKWPLERYAECVARLNQQRAVQPLIVCGDEEDEEASALSAQLAIPPYILSRLPLRAVCAVLAHCDLFLGNDTGTAHLAAAMQCPTMVVSRHPADGNPDHPNSPARFAPWGTRRRVLQPLSGTDGCTASCRQPGPHCILQVTVNQVVEAALPWLGDFEPAVPALHFEPTTDPPAKRESFSLEWAEG